MKKFLLAASVLIIPGFCFAEANLDFEKKAKVACFIEELVAQHQDVDTQEFDLTRAMRTEFFWRERQEIQCLMKKLFS